MNWLLFFLLEGLYVVAFFVIWKRCTSWKRRFQFWSLLSIPAILYCWDFFAIQIEHERMCKAEAGFKVFIQPEKVDRVRFVTDSYSEAWIDSAFDYFPQARVVERMTKERDSKGNLLQRYDAYTASPNPNAGKPMKVSPWKERPYVVSITPVVSPDPSLYEISKRESEGKHYYRTETLLSKNGQIYAKHTELRHWWGGIQYPDAVPHWRCNGETQSATQSTASKEEWLYRYPV